MLTLLTTSSAQLRGPSKQLLDDTLFDTRAASLDTVTLQAICRLLLVVIEFMSPKSVHFHVYTGCSHSASKSSP